MKKRLDVLLVEQGLAPSREKAKALLMAGIVYVNGQKEDKAGSTFEEETAQLEVRGQTLPYVSRGGLKLEKALQAFPIDLSGRVCMDIGASTGGFTDCMLQNGAAYVYSIDVGYGQLDWKLRNDDRVCCMEKTNFRYLKREELLSIGASIADIHIEGDSPADGQGHAEYVDNGTDRIPTFASCDVSFISLSKILPPAYEILADEAEMVCLIKPQFEAGREKVGKKGVVRDPAVHEEVIERTLKTAAEAGFVISGLDFSPIRGPEGNIEYLLYLKKITDQQIDVQDVRKKSVTELNSDEDENRATRAIDGNRIRSVVEASHQALEHQ